MNERLQRLLTIAGNTIRESLRNRIVYALLGSTGLIMLGSVLLGWVTVEEEDKVKVIIDFSLSAITLFGALTSIFLGTNLIYQEVEQRTVYTLLARPLSRGEFIVGKFLGLVGVNAICVAAMGLFFILFLMLNGGSVSLTMLQALYLVFVELAVITGIALVFSVTAHPIEGAVFALVLTLAGHSTANIRQLGKDVIGRQEGDLSILNQLMVRGLDLLYVVLPNLENFNIRTEAAHHLPVPWSFIGMATAYALFYGAVLMLLAVWSFSRRVL